MIVKRKYDGKIEEVTRWFKVGDHPKVKAFPVTPETDAECLGYNRPKSEHGWIEGMTHMGAVCPGNYLVPGVLCDITSCSPESFEAEYEEVK